MRLNKFATLCFGLALSCSAYAQSLAPATGGGSAAPSGAAGGDMAGTYPNPTIAKIQGTTVSGTTGSGNAVLSASPTFSGTVTFPDTSSRSSTGFIDTNSYTTASTAIETFNTTWNFSATGNQIGPYLFGTTLVPTGVSAGNLYLTRSFGTMGSSAANTNLLALFDAAFTENVGYTGTLSNLYYFHVSNTMISGNPVTTSVGFQYDSNSNGTGIASGTVNNYGARFGAITAVAAPSGTLNNTMLSLAMPSGVNAGTATNCGLCITGNGQTGGATNYAINSTSTATTNISSSSVLFPGIGASASALDYLCWNASTGAITGDGSGTCLASREELKDRVSAISAVSALWDVMWLQPFWGKYKDGVTSTSDHRVHAMLGAHQVESIDPRLASYDDSGYLRGVRYAEMSALLISAIKGLTCVTALLLVSVVFLMIKVYRERV